MHDTLLNEQQTAKVLTVSIRCLQSWRHSGSCGPSFFKIGRLVRYRQADLEEWIENQRRRSTSDKGQAG